MLQKNTSLPNEWHNIPFQLQVCKMEEPSGLSIWSPVIPSTFFQFSQGNIHSEDLNSRLRMVLKPNLHLNSGLPFSNIRLEQFCASRNAWVSVRSQCACAHSQ